MKAPRMKTAIRTVTVAAIETAKFARIDRMASARKKRGLTGG